MGRARFIAGFFGLAVTQLSGCSLIFAPSDHMSGGMDAATVDGGSPDGAVDGGVLEDGGPGVDPGDYCDRVAALACDAVRGCCGRLTDPSMWNDATCLAHFHEFCDPLIARVLERSYLIWDPHAAERTLAEGERLGADCDTAFMDWQINRDGFFGPVVGGRAGGVECTPARIEVLEVEDSLLSCEGENRCIPGDGLGSPWRCQPPSTAMGRCTFAFDCANPTHRCVSSGLVTRCRAAGEDLGSRCALPDECASRVCTRGECVAATQENIFCIENTGVPSP